MHSVVWANDMSSASAQQLLPRAVRAAPGAQRDTARARAIQVRKSTALVGGRPCAVEGGTWHAVAGVRGLGWAQLRPAISQKAVYRAVFDPLRRALADARLTT